MRARMKKHHKPEKNKQGSYRIIAGEWRSRRLAFPDVEGLRPSTDRLRETLFNWLSSYLDGAQVLDMFAGSGSLGFEALSRGAKHCVFLELNKNAANALVENTDLLGASAQTIQIDAIRWASESNEMFDVVFLDPPFRKNLVVSALESLISSGALAPNAFVYIEQEKEMPAPRTPSGWHLLREKEAGQVCYRLYEACTSE